MRSVHAGIRAFSLCRFLEAMVVANLGQLDLRCIKGVGTNVIFIRGVKRDTCLRIVVERKPRHHL